MTHVQKFKQLHEKDTINVLFQTLDNPQWSCKIKFFYLMSEMLKNKKFNIIKSNNSLDYLKENYDSVDLFFPVQPYICNSDDELVKKLRNDKKFVVINYCYTDYKPLYCANGEQLLYFVDEPQSQNIYKHIFYCPSPYFQEYVENNSNLHNPFDKNKKNVFIPIHWTQSITSLHGLHSTFYKIYDDMLKLKQKYEKDINFILKPHPDLVMYLQNGSGVLNRYNIKINIREIFKNIETDFQLYNGPQWSAFKYADCIIHDCGSFRFETLFGNKPIGYMCNEFNTSRMFLWTKSVTEAFNCHEKLWNIEDIEKFILKSLDGVDKYKEQRKHVLNKYYYAFPQRPTDFIIDKILNSIENDNSKNLKHFLLNFVTDCLEKDISKII